MKITVNQNIKAFLHLTSEKTIRPPLAGVFVKDNKIIACDSFMLGVAPLTKEGTSDFTIEKVSDYENKNNEIFIPKELLQGIKKLNNSTPDFNNLVIGETEKEIELGYINKNNGTTIESLGKEDFKCIDYENFFNIGKIECEFGLSVTLLEKILKFYKEQKIDYLHFQKGDKKKCGIIVKESNGNKQDTELVKALIMPIKL